MTDPINAKGHKLTNGDGYCYCKHPENHTNLVSATDNIKARTGALFLDSHETAPEGSVYFPTLEELIEACGDAFFALHTNLNRDGYVAKTGILGEKKGEGKTTSEAVARLWLALNKKEEGIN